MSQFVLSTLVTSKYKEDKGRYAVNCLGNLNGSFCPPLSTDRTQRRSEEGPKALAAPSTAYMA